MRKTTVLISTTALAAALAIGATMHAGQASDHDDGEHDKKPRALNLTDHFAFKSPADPSKLSLVMYFNPRSLPGRQYSMSTNARYEFHVSKVADKLAAPTVADDYVFRFEAQAPDAAGVQQIKLTVLKDGEVVGSVDGASTAFAASQANAITKNTGNAGVELGQLAIVLLIAPPILLLQRWPRAHHVVVRVLAAAICAAGLYWFVERLCA